MAPTNRRGPEALPQLQVEVLEQTTAEKEKEKMKERLQRTITMTIQEFKAYTTPSGWRMTFMTGSQAYNGRGGYAFEVSITLEQSEL